MPLDIEEELTFTFEHDPRRAFEILQPHSEVHTLLDKWGLLQGTQLAAFRFNEAFPHRGLLGPLLSSLFASSAFRLNVLPADGRGGALNNGFPKLADEATHMPVRLMGSDPQPSQGSSSKSNAESITVVPLVSRETTLQLFDRLVNGEIVRPAVDARGNEVDDAEESTAPQRVCQMMDVYLPCGVTVSDQLRGLFMLGDESEHAGTFTDEEKQEFLYHVMWRLCAGGALCQWEDDFQKYKDVARLLYKDLVCVGRSEDDGELTILSHVVQVVPSAAWSGGGEGPKIGGVSLFPKDDGCSPSNGNYMYVIVNGTRKEVVVWYHGFWSTF